MQKTEKPPATEFQSQLIDVIEHLRGSLIELLSSVEIDPAVPYAVARRLGINKNLSWKLCRVISTEDPLAAITHLPGTQGIDILLEALAHHGAPASALSSARAALVDFENVVETHAGDRRTLDLILASHHEAPPEPAEDSRRMAYEGNSAIWGLQARVRFATYFVAPSAEDESMVASAILGGLIDVRRLRPNVGAPVFRMGSYNDDGSPRNPQQLPLDPDRAPDDPSMLIRSFCSRLAAPLRRQMLAGAIQFELPRGPVGRTGVTSWVYGWRTPRMADTYRDGINRIGEHSTRLFVPVENVQCDLHIHRSLPYGKTLRRVLYSQLAGPYVGPDQPCDELPLREQIVTLGGSPPVVATPLLPRYSEWIRWAYERLAWEPREFAVFRLVMKYPPIPTALVLRYDLPERPEAT